MLPSPAAPAAPPPAAGPRKTQRTGAPHCVGKSHSSARAAAASAAWVSNSCQGFFRIFQSILPATGGVAWAAAATGRNAVAPKLMEKA